MYESPPDWAPSLHLGHSEIKPSDTAQFASPANRKRRRTESTPAMDETAVDDSTQKEAAPISLGEDGEEHAGGTEVCKPAEKRPVTECDFCVCRCAEINLLLEVNRALKCELERRKMDEQFLKDDNVKVKYYTGLPDFEVLMGLLNLVVAHLPQTVRVLSPFQMLFLTLMRLRLNLPILHIAHLFYVDRKSVSKIFNNTVSVLNARISPLVHWLGRDALHITMPHQVVEAFGKCVAVILDCFEILTQRPSSLKAQAQSFSHYKHNTTMKYLIGVTPQGSVAFISKGWGGCVSNKHIIENWGILDKLLPGDVVLADRGCDISDSVGLMCAEVKIPAFTKGRCQLDTRDAEETRKTAHLRIHVGRVIGSIGNKYTILASKVPISMVLPCEGEDMTSLDKIVTVCCSLTNMWPSLVVKQVVL